MTSSKTIIKVGAIQQRILLVRGEKVILDADLAEFYGAPTKALNQAVRRNKRRFPQDYVSQLTSTEKAEVVTFCDHLSKLKYSHSNPFAFTEYGAIMAASARIKSDPRWEAVEFATIHPSVSMHDLRRR